ncbi:hypothetical protein [Arenibacter certesii]|nr:hypothetical protein [Arenibacter certesii]
MSYKIKSLLYFICFMGSSLLYYSMDIENEQSIPVQSVKTTIEDSDTLKPNERISELYETTEQPQYSGS